MSKGSINSSSTFCLKGLPATVRAVSHILKGSTRLPSVTHHLHSQSFEERVSKSSLSLYSQRKINLHRKPYSFSMIGTVLLGAAIGWIAWCLVALRRNIQLARSIGLPYFIWFYHETWLTFALTPAVYFRLVPSCWKDEALFASGSRRHQVKNRITEKYGPVVVIASPGGLSIIVADAEATAQITLGRDFPKRAKEYGTWLSLTTPQIIC